MRMCKQADKVSHLQMELQVKNASQALAEVNAKAAAAQERLAAAEAEIKEARLVTSLYLLRMAVRYRTSSIKHTEAGRA